MGDRPSDAAAKPLYTPVHIALAALLATPIAGALLAAKNLAAQNRHGGPSVVLLASTTVALCSLDLWGAGPWNLLLLPALAVLSWVLARAAFARSLATAPVRSFEDVALVVLSVWLCFVIGGGAVAITIELRGRSPDDIDADQDASGRQSGHVAGKAPGASRQVAGEFASGSFSGCACASSSSPTVVTSSAP